MRSLCFKGKGNRSVEINVRGRQYRDKAKKLAVKKPVKRVIPKIEVSEEKVRQYMQGAPDTLPEDINYALAHLRAYLEARFS